MHSHSMSDVLGTSARHAGADQQRSFTTAPPSPGPRVDYQVHVTLRPGRHAWVQQTHGITPVSQFCRAPSGSPHVEGLAGTELDSLQDLQLQGLGGDDRLTWDVCIRNTSSCTSLAALG